VSALHAAAVGVVKAEEVHDVADAAAARTKVAQKEAVLAVVICGETVERAACARRSWLATQAQRRRQLGQRRSECGIERLQERRRRTHNYNLSSKILALDSAAVLTLVHRPPPGQNTHIVHTAGVCRRWPLRSGCGNLAADMYTLLISDILFL
jgi:hypothetical protein